MADLSFDVVALDRASRVFIDMAEQVERLSRRIDQLDGQRATAEADVDTAPADNALQRLLRSVPGIGDSMADGLSDGLAGGAAKIAAAGAAVGGALMVGVMGAMEKESANANLAARLGLSGDEAGRLGKVAGDLYAGAWGESMQDVSDSIVLVRQNIAGMATASDDELSKVSALAMDLSTAFGVDLAGSTRAVGVMLRTGMAPDAQAAFDILTVGMQNGVNVADDLLDTFTEYSTQFQKFGIDGAQATGILSQGLQAGARDADIVADAIKEFSIRAIDGSESTAAGFAALGLSASDMAGKFGQGGAVANAALDLTLDRLRAIPDPVARSQAAVNLFGTQAEDLGQALFAIDPSSAVTALGDVGGAAQRMSDTLNDTAAVRIEGFRRSLMTGFVDLIGGHVLPALDKLTEAGATVLGPAWEPVKSLLAWLAGTGGVVVGVILAIAGATWAWSAAAAALTAATFPISGTVLAVIAVVTALVAAVLWAWNNFEGFRTVVLAVWEGIKTAAVATWEGFLRPVFDAIVVAATAVGTAAMWLWQNAIVPAFNGISAAVTVVGDVITWLWVNVAVPAFDGIMLAGKILWAVLATVVLTPLMLLMQGVGAVVGWLWENAFKPAWEAIAAAVLFAWDAVIRPAFEALVGFINNVLIPANMWLWENVIVPVWNAIGAAIKMVWDMVVKPVWDAMVAGINVLAQVATWLWQNVIVPVWNGISNAISLAWSTFIQPVFDAMRTGVDLVARSFETAVGFIGRVWDGVKGAVRGPIDAVINVVYNHGVVKAWNLVAGLVGLSPLTEYHLPAFAQGGPVTQGRGPKRDDVLARLSRGEHVWTDEEVARAGGHGVVEHLRRSARAGELQAAMGALRTGTVVEGAGHNGPGSVTTGFGGVQPHVAQAGHFLGRMFGISNIGGRGARPNASDHPFGLALDFMTRGENGTALANHLFSQWAHYAVKYVIWRQRIANSPGAWQAMANRGSDTANHMDHVHVSFLGGLGGGSVGAGGAGSAAVSVFDPVAWLMERIPFLRDAADALKGGNPWAEMAVRMGRKMVQGTWDFLVQKAQDALGWLGGGGGAAGASGDVVGQVKAVAARYGWDTGEQWAALDRLIQKESSWNPSAANPTSSARGLFQKMTSIHGPVEPTAGGQAEWGLNYIRGRYGNPVAALGFHNRNNWYANGGLITRPTFGVLGESGPEVVLPLNRPQRAGELADRAGLGSGGGFHVHLTTEPGQPAERVIGLAMHEARVERMARRYARAW